MPGEHAYFSPSAASRWLKCPASLYLSESIPQEPSSSFAHEGTVCHTIAADCILKKVTPTDFAGKIIERVSMTAELIEGIQLYVDEIQGLAKEYQATQGKIEHKIKITEECWGTADALLWNSGTLVVCDLKMGKGIVVAAEDNDQLKLYAMGALFSLADIQDFRPMKVVMVIIQPRTPDPVRKVEMLVEDLREWFSAKVAPVISVSGKGKKIIECHPGEVQCRWCPVAKRGCVAEAQKNIADAQQAFAPFSEVVSPVVEGKKGILTLGELAALKRTFSCIKKWIEKIDILVNERALAGDSIPGFKLVEGRSVRVWGEKEEKIITFLENLNVDPYTKKLLSPTQAEKIVGKKNTDLPALIVKPQGKPTLVLQSDKRMEINTKKDVENSFADTILVENSEVEEMSVLQRMKFAEDEEEEKKEEENSRVLDRVKTASGGTPKVATSAYSAAKAIPPAKNTKRFKILQLGKEGTTTVQMAMDAIECTENMVKMHLKYLNERDGYNYEIYDDFTFKVTEGE